MKTTNLFFSLFLFATIISNSQTKSILDTADFIIDGEDLIGSGGNDYRLGYYVNNAGDINGDNYDDVIVGASGYNNDQGKVFIIFGGDSLSTPIPPTELTGQDTLYEFGYRVSTAGDVNNDGYDDVVIGAVKYNSFKGKVYVYYGSSSGLSSSTELIINEDSTHFGCSVNNAGDVNGDGYDDIIIGACQKGALNGAAYIFYGSSSGIDTIPDVSLWLPGGANNLFGWAVNTAGDINNDGFSDVIIGAPKSTSFKGKAFVYLGGNNMDSVPDIALEGLVSSDNFGWDVSAAGDVNQDGFDDFMVSSTYFNDSTGQVYLFFGTNSINPNPNADIIFTGENEDNYFGRSISAAGDINNDGYDDIIIGASRYNDYTGKTYIFLGGNNMDNFSDAELYGETTMNYFGKSISTAGDFNNDGISDIIIGAWKYNSKCGRSYIFYGNTNATAIETYNKSNNCIIYPNPSNQKFNINIENESNSYFEINIYDVFGKKVKDIFAGNLQKGQHTFIWDITKKNKIVSGVYFCNIKTQNKTIVKKIIVE